MKHSPHESGVKTFMDAQCTNLQTVPYARPSNISVVIVFIRHIILKKRPFYMEHIIISFYISPDISNYKSALVLALILLNARTSLILSLISALL